MIIALVQFRLPQPLSREEAREIFMGTAPKYRKIHGLIRKKLHSFPGWSNGRRNLFVEFQGGCPAVVFR